MTIATYRGVQYTVGAPGGEGAQQEPVSELAVIKEQVIKQDKLKKVRLSQVVVCPAR